MTSVEKYTVGKVMQLIPINDDLNEFSMDFYLKGNDAFHFAVCDQNALDNGTTLDFKQSNNKEVSGNIKSNGEPKSYYIALKSINEKVEINVSLAPRPVDMTPVPNAPKQQKPPPQPQRPPPQQQRPPPQQQRPPPQQQRPPPQQQRPPPQQQRPPPQQQRPPPQQQRPPPQQQRGMPPRQKPPPQQQRGMPPRQRPPQNRMPSKPVSKGYHQEHHDLKLERGMPANVKMWCLGGVTVILLGTVVWYFISRSNKRASKNSSPPALEYVVETGSTIAAEASDAINAGAKEVLSGGSDLLSKLKALPSSSRSRSRV